MRKIGQGLSYTVYEISNNRVMKKPTFNFYKFSKLLYWSVRHRINFSLVKKLRPIISSGKMSINILRDNIENIDLDIIGNPIFCDSLEYSQDKVIILKDYFKLHTFEENKKIIDLYVENIFQTWTCGFSDVDFNFAMNSGVNDSNCVVLADINGLSFSKKEIFDIVVSRVWLKKHSYLVLKDLDLKKYFKVQMEKKVTVDNLNKYWKDLI